MLSGRHCAGTWLHGEAVAAGIVMAADLSRRLGWIDKALFDRTLRLIERAELPVAPPKVTPYSLLSQGLEIAPWLRPFCRGHHLWDTRLLKPCLDQIRILNMVSEPPHPQPLIRFRYFVAGTDIAFVVPARFGML